MVVRNPYERIISEFYCKWGGLGNINTMDCITNEIFNLYIKECILKRSLEGDHYTEQYKYVDKNIPIHILKFENIEIEFNNLMKEYNLDVNLNIKKNVSQKKKFTKKSFTPELIKLINEIYDKDFTLFGYKKIKL